jgi:hypothetical protein
VSCGDGSQILIRHWFAVTPPANTPQSTGQSLLVPAATASQLPVALPATRRRGDSATALHRCGFLDVVARDPGGARVLVDLT